MYGLTKEDLIVPIEEETDRNKAKVVAVVWGAEFIQFHAAVQI